MPGPPDPFSVDVIQEQVRNGMHGMVTLQDLQNLESSVMEQLTAQREEIAQRKQMIIAQHKKRQLARAHLTCSNEEKQELYEMLEHYKEAVDESKHVAELRDRKIKDIAAAWLLTWRNRPARFPSIGRRRREAHMDHSQRSNAPQDNNNSNNNNEKSNHKPAIMDDDTETKLKLNDRKSTQSNRLSQQLQQSHTSSSVDDAEQQQVVEVYQWVDSCWDMGHLIGAHGKPGQAIYSTLLVVINIVMQLMLCLLLNDAFGTPLVDQNVVHDLRTWRVSHGHDIGKTVSMTDQTLINRICNGHTVLPYSTSVAELFAMSTAYIGSTDLHIMYGGDPVLKQWWVFDNYWIGMSMCYFCLVIWWMFVAQDAEHMYNLIAALTKIPVLETTQILKHGHNRSLGGVSMKRKQVIYLLTFIRAIICFITGLTGTMFMIYTTSLADILLNAAALSIVLEIDNLVFVAFAPGQARALLCSMLPMELPPDFKIASISIRYPITLGTMVIMAVCVTQFVLVPQAEDIHQVQNEICGGQLGFTTVLAGNGAVISAASSQMNAFETVQYTYQYKAVRKMAFEPLNEQGDNEIALLGMSTSTYRSTEGDLSGYAAGVQGPYYSVKAISAMGLDIINGFWNTDCSDAPPLSACKYGINGGCWQMWVLQNSTRDRNIISCLHAKKYCGEDSLGGVRVRQHCPQACACDDPFSANLFATKSMGCAPACFNLKRDNILAAATCQDANLASATFKRYIDGIDAAMSSYPAGQYEFAKPIMDAIKAEGCGAAGRLVDSFGYKVDLCETFNFLLWKPLISICPVSCKCSQRMKKEHEFGSFCPTTCLTR